MVLLETIHRQENIKGKNLGIKVKIKSILTKMTNLPLLPLHLASEVVVAPTQSSGGAPTQSIRRGTSLRRKPQLLKIRHEGVVRRGPL